MVGLEFNRRKWRTDGSRLIRFEYRKCQSCGGPEFACYDPLHGPATEACTVCMTSARPRRVRIETFLEFCYKTGNTEYVIIDTSEPEPEKGEPRFTVTTANGDPVLKYRVLDNDKGEVIAAARNPEILGKLVQLLVESD